MELRSLNRRFRLVFWIGIVVFTALNISAFMQVYAMTHYSDGGIRTERPEALSNLQRLKALFFGVEIPKPRNDRSPSDVGLTYQTVDFQGRQGRLEAWSVPHPQSQTVILMFHGYAASKSSLLPEAKKFFEMGMDPFLVDLGGHGGSEGHRTTLGYFEAEDVKAAWDEAKSRYPKARFVLYGVSMGAASVMRAIARYRIRPDAVVLECPFDRLIATTKNRFKLLGIPSFPGAELLVFWGGVQNGFNGFRLNPIDDASSIESPVLLMIGDKDRRVTLGEIAGVFARLHTLKKMVVFEGAGHESYERHDPERWAREVGDFLSAKTVGKGSDGL